jgi:branched-chain amino acid aminotransferase
MMDTVSNILIERVETSKIQSVDFDNIQFGKQFSDHMFVAEYKNGEWKNLKIEPYAPISLSPSCAAIHYGQSVFEGMKAYKDDNGNVLLFRPRENAKRINVSAKRMCMPEVPEELFMDAIYQLVQLDSAWVPQNKGCSLYIRPFIFASEELLGVRPAEEYKFMIITSPVCSYYTGAVDVKIETHYTRAAEGGVGFAKAAGNYAAALYPAKLGQEKGFKQLIWTDAKNHEYIEESGTMNVMFLIDNKIITPSISLNTTLAGITRDSVLKLAQEMGIEVEERRVSVKEIVEAARNNRLQDAFGTGTAATIAQIASITYEDEKFELPALENRVVSNQIAETIDAIKRGNVEDKYGWIYKI